jgi:metal-sulfur cluster biosynthetic enzyme
MDLKEKIVSEIKKIYDPEIPVNIYELGLIYDISVNDKKEAESLPQEVKDSVKQLNGIEKVELDLVWDPPWDKSMMSEAAKLELNL